MNCPFGCRVSNYPNAQRICQHHWPEKEARFVEPHPPSHLSASVQRERSRKYWIEALSCRKNCSHPSTNCMRSLSLDECYVPNLNIGNVGYSVEPTCLSFKRNSKISCFQFVFHLETSFQQVLVEKSNDCEKRKRKKANIYFKHMERMPFEIKRLGKGRRGRR